MACGPRSRAGGPKRRPARLAPRVAVGLARRTGVGLALLAGSAAGAEPGAGPEEIVAHARCEPRATPGRVRCRVDIVAPRGNLMWSDVLIVSAPPSTVPLRVRVGASAASLRNQRRHELQLSLAAKQIGGGALRLLARAVVCRRGRTGCAPTTAEVQATVRVEPEAGPPGSGQP